MSWSVLSEYLPAGSVVSDRYRILRRMGEGGFGVVYAVEHLQLKKTFALKVLNRDLSHDSVMIERLRREAIAASKINHPNIVSVVDFGTTSNGQAYYVMEYLEGDTLANILEVQKVFGASRAIPILAAICHALESAHKAGIVHRDLKPDNILLVPLEDIQHGVKRDFVKILDFGLAKITEQPSQPRLSTAGIAMGTLGYIAPEALRGQEVDHRADIYSLGCIAFEMLAGSPVFSGPPIALLTNHCETPAPLVRVRNPAAKIPDRLETLIDQCLQKEPKRRPATCQAVLDELRELAEELLAAEQKPRPAIKSWTGTSVSHPASVSLQWWDELSITALSSYAARRGEDEPTSQRPFSDLVLSGAEAGSPVRPVPTPADDTTPPMGIVAAPAPRSAPKLRALIIEGDKAFAEQLRGELEMRSYLAEVELDPSAVMTRVETERPDVIILCAELEGSSGFPVCNRLKRDERWKTTPLILTSARETARTWRQHEKLPTRADAYLCKPFTTDELIAAISSLTRPELAAGQTDRMPRGLPGSHALKGLTERLRAAEANEPQALSWFASRLMVVAAVVAALSVGIAGWALYSTRVRHGAVVINVRPASAQVRLNGTATPPGPLRVVNRVAAGPVLLEASYPGCQPQATRVVVEPGQVAVGNLVLQCARAVDRR